MLSSAGHQLFFDDELCAVFQVAFGDSFGGIHPFNLHRFHFQVAIFFKVHYRYRIEHTLAVSIAFSIMLFHIPHPGVFADVEGLSLIHICKCYQMDYHNRREALKEALSDVAEGADIIMVKPALSYLDIIREVADAIDLPVAAYSVSGEYAMIKAGAKLGYIDEERLICETAASIYRAGSGILLSYYAKEIAALMRRGLIG